ncbi:phage tail collar domain-containing protein [Escherichia coli]|nr:phage tail collar domain-containing protein [Escherichia coli]
MMMKAYSLRWRTARKRTNRSYRKAAVVPDYPHDSGCHEYRSYHAENRPVGGTGDRKYVDDEVLELRLYVDDQMSKHIAAQDPHTQYAQKHNPTFTGEPKAPTPAAGNNTTRIATTAFVQAAITALINGAPDTLDTLKEIAAAINNDPKFSTTINNALAGKQPLDNTLTHLSGKDVAGLLAYLGLEKAQHYLLGCLFHGLQPHRQQAG